MTRPQCRPRKLTRGDQNIDWIEQHCRRDDGRNVMLTQSQRDEVRKLYDADVVVHVIDPADTQLAAYRLLLQLCGIEARADTRLDPVPGAVFVAACKAMSPYLRTYLTVGIGEMSCPGLRTAVAVAR